MKKIIFVCGLIAGLISASWCVVGEKVLNDSVGINARTWLGYTFMILALSLIFVGVKQYRDNYNNGVISFGRAFVVGLYITLIASTVYVLVWLAAFYTIIPNYFEKYAELVRQQMIADGASAAAIKQQMAQIASLTVMYKNPVFNFLFTFLEIFPVGLVISLIVAAILRKKSVVIKSAV